MQGYPFDQPASEFVAVSNVMKRPNFTVREILEADDCVLGCMNSFEPLLSYVSTPEVVAEMVRVMLSARGNGAQDEAKASAAAAELLTKDSLKNVCAAFIGDDGRILKSLFELFYADAPLEHNAAVFFEKVASSIMEREPDKVLEVMGSLDGLVERIVQQLHDSAIVQYLRSLIMFKGRQPPPNWAQPFAVVKVAPPAPVAEVQRFLSKGQLVQTLLARLEPSEDFNVRDSASQLLCCALDCAMDPALPSVSPLLLDIIGRPSALQLVRYIKATPPFRDVAMPHPALAVSNAIMTAFERVGSASPQVAEALRRAGREAEADDDTRSGDKEGKEGKDAKAPEGTAEASTPLTAANLAALDNATSTSTPASAAGPSDAEKPSGETAAVPVPGQDGSSVMSEVGSSPAPSMPATSITAEDAAKTAESGAQKDDPDAAVCEGINFDVGDSDATSSGGSVRELRTNPAPALFWLLARQSAQNWILPDLTPEAAKTPLGSERLQRLTLLAHLLHGAHEHFVAKRPFLAHPEGCYVTALRYMVAYPWNSALHEQVLRMMQEVLDSPETGAGAARLEVVGSDARAMVLEAVDKNAASEALEKRSVRLGYMGHVVILANALEAVAQSWPDVQLREDVAARWQAYVAGDLAKYNQLNAKPLGEMTKQQPQNPPNQPDGAWSGAAGNDGGYTGIALYDFEGGEPGDLVFPAGAIITNVRGGDGPEADPAWLFGDYGGKRGMFPAAWIRRHEPQGQENLKRPLAWALYDFNGSDDGRPREDELTFTAGELISGVVSAEEEWYFGTIGERSGLFPKTFVELWDDRNPSGSEEDGGPPNVNGIPRPEGMGGPPNVPPTGAPPVFPEDLEAGPGGLGHSAPELGAAGRTEEDEDRWGSAPEISAVERGVGALRLTDGPVPAVQPQGVAEVLLPKGRDDRDAASDTADGTSDMGPAADAWHRERMSEAGSFVPDEGGESVAGSLASDLASNASTEGDLGDGAFGGAPASPVGAAPPMASHAMEADAASGDLGDANAVADDLVEETVGLALASPPAASEVTKPDQGAASPPGSSGGSGTSPTRAAG